MGFTQIIALIGTDPHKVTTGSDFRVRCSYEPYVRVPSSGRYVGCSLLAMHAFMTRTFHINSQGGRVLSY
jgi:hypothetical protein